jgi:phosphatidylserine/phosphatidylglycerophosphate/cardiolipin synthase-like enzyme
LRQKHTPVILHELESIRNTLVGRSKLVLDPVDGMAAVVSVMREARHTLDISHYQVRDSVAFDIFLQEIRAALKRGVHVRLLIDWWGSHNFAQFLGLHPRAGIIRHDQKVLLSESQSKG